MATKTFKTPYGPVEVENPRGEPTAEDLEMLGKMAYGVNEPTTATPEVKISTGLAPALGGAGPFLTQTRGGFPKGYTEEQFKTDIAALPAAITRTASLGAAMIPGAGAIHTAGRFAVPAIGEFLARTQEGKPAFSKEGIGEAAKSSITVGTPGPFIQSVERFLPTIKEAVKVGLTAAGQEGAGEVVKRSIGTDDEPITFRSYDSIKDALKGMGAPAAFGGGLATVAGAGNAIFNKRASLLAQRELLKDVGIEKPNQTLGMIDPSFAGIETAKLSAGDPALLAKSEAANAGMFREMFRRVASGQIPGNADVAQELNKVVNAVSQADAAYGTAKKQYTDALMKWGKVEENAARLLPEEKLAMRTAAEAEMVNFLNKQAEEILKAKHGLGSLVRPSETAAEVGNVLGKLMDVRKAISDTNYAKVHQGASAYRGATVDDSTPIFSLNELLLAARGKVGMAEQSTEKFNKLFKAASEYPQGVPVMAGDKVVDRTLNLAQYRELKDMLAEVSAGYAAKGTASASERMGGTMYDGIRNAAYGKILAEWGPAAEQAIKEADAFYATNKRLQNAPLARALLTKASDNASKVDESTRQVADQYIAGIASGFLEGKTDEIGAFRQFIEDLSANTRTLQGGAASDASKIAAAAMDTMADAVRNSLIWKYTKEGGGMQEMFAKLQKLAESEAKGGSKLPIPVESLRFGNLSTIRQWNQVLKSYRPEEIDNVVIANTLGNPYVLEAITRSAPNADQAIRKGLGEEIFRNRVNEITALRVAGKMKAAEEAAKQAERTAEIAGLDAQTKQNLLREAQANPVMAAFGRSGAQGEYTFSNQAGLTTGPGTVAHFLNQLPAESRAPLMSALQENNPQLHNLIKQRFVASFLEDVLPQGGNKIDIKKLDQMFAKEDSPLYKQSPLWQLRVSLGNDDATVKRVEKFVRAAANVYNGIEAGVASAKFNDDLEKIGAILGASMTTGSAIKYNKANFIERIGNLFKGWYYNTWSHLLVEPDGSLGKVFRATADAAANAGGTISPAIQELPLIKAWMLTTDKPLSDELADLDKPVEQRRSRRGTALPPVSPQGLALPQPPAPQAPAPKKTSFMEGQIYKDRNGIRKRYSNGSWLDPEALT